MTREEFYKLTDILNSEVLGSFMHGGEADELIAMFEDVVEHSNILKQEEPISEELEEAADNALSNVLNTHEIVNVRSCLEMFKSGAKWKEERIMAKAVDAHVNYMWSGLSFGGFDWSKTGLDLGDKCKLIIIKED